MSVNRSPVWQGSCVSSWQVTLLEEVIEESVYSLGRYGESYSILTQCRKYIDQVHLPLLCNNPHLAQYLPGDASTIAMSVQ